VLPPAVAPLPPLPPAGPPLVAAQPHSLIATAKLLGAMASRSGKGGDDLADEDDDHGDDLAGGAAKAADDGGNGGLDCSDNIAEAIICGSNEVLPFLTSLISVKFPYYYRLAMQEQLEHYRKARRPGDVISQKKYNLQKMGTSASKRRTFRRVAKGYGFYPFIKLHSCRSRIYSNTKCI
jgi:hypothetical protein